MDLSEDLKMALNGISQYGGLYNNYRVVDIPKVDVKTVEEQDLKKREEAVVPSLETFEPVVADNRTKSADLENISLNFNKNDDYSYIGMDFSIESLDMEQAISDMKKDKILEDYQYFVGSSTELNEKFASEDGKVMLKF
jgi:hypothetical protein